MASATPKPNAASLMNKALAGFGAAPIKKAPTPTPSTPQAQSNNQISPFQGMVSAASNPQLNVNPKVSGASNPQLNVIPKVTSGNNAQSNANNKVSQASTPQPTASNPPAPVARDKGGRTEGEVGLSD